ncbi:hypothetical protein CKM354_000924500 [Cercospora kikuchii]|uniref:Zn(2)-C6 fungal-type domain-containing protein n=1 Tax=Cercospora kikuchii TaxID=84275 RepID=A0A9P3CP04_9PEZI|nr:uncharacterized protein CKM354_000924500 [Cercospora kikuchii]GIZ46106.1 hypothetical protein CKM354_000924500 [Cercospora kikuchii]
MASETQPAQVAPTASPPEKNGSSGGSAPKQPLKRACDCCRKRKVRCDGQDPCTPCKKASIRCAYLAIPKKKGPKGLRSARVLHALRRIDDDASSNTHSSASPPSPRQAFGSNWGWGTNGSVPPGATPYQGQHSRDAIYAQPTSVAPDQPTYYQPMPTSMPQPHVHAVKPEPQTQRPLPPTPPQRSWTGNTHQTASAAGSDGHSRVYSPSASEHHSHRAIPPETFLPFVQLFFEHMFAIMPILDRSVFLDSGVYSNHNMSSEMYAFLCALCATTVIQLDTSIPQPPSIHPVKRNDAIFAEECLRERKNFDYPEQATTLNVMTSFFLFCFYGNHEKHNQAWYFLQESITFSENMCMDDEEEYDKLDPIDAQWRRRLYWLLFITERAYAVQRRKRTRLSASVSLPAVFESEDPQLLNGFVNLANLFSAVDDSFVSAWRGTRRASLCDEAWLVRTQKQLDESVNANLVGALSETQQLDISITREWLHVLAWQMGVSNGLIWGQGEAGMRLDYPVELARKVVEITSGASALALDSHGIGMEQKISDIAGCLADVLRCTAGDTSATFLEGKHYLHVLLNRLSSMRGKESRYLKPLMAKVEGLAGFEMQSVTLPPPDEQRQIFAPGNNSNAQLPSIFSTNVDGRTSPQWSMRQSVSMLRTLSMCGNLGMPNIAVMEDGGWDQQRRPSVRPLAEDELGMLQPWLQVGPM